MSVRDGVPDKTCKACGQATIWPDYCTDCCMNGKADAHTATQCEVHKIPLITEKGGPDMPTIRGRMYCPQCQTAFMDALEQEGHA